MTVPNTSVFNPFEPVAAEETDELNRLARALELAEGFTLLLARCNQPDQRKRVVARFRNEHPELDIQEIHFSNPIHHLLDELRLQIRNPLPDAVFVSGLENSLPRADAAYATPVILNLNAARNSFPSVVLCPLVLWVPEYVLGAIMRGSPDLFSVRSGVYFFASSPANALLLASTTSGAEWQVSDLTAEEKQKLVQEITELLEDFQSLPANQRDPHSEVALLNRLAHLHCELGNWSDAEATLRNALHIARMLNWLDGVNGVVDNLANMYIEMGELERARDILMKGSQEYGHLEDIEDRINRGVMLGWIAYKQGKMEEAERLYLSALQLLEKHTDAHATARVYNGLAVLYSSQQRFDEAERLLRHALDLTNETGYKTGRAILSVSLGNLHLQIGEYSNARVEFQTALDLFRTLGDVSGCARALNNLGLLAWNEGRVSQAASLLRDSAKLTAKQGDARGTAETLYNLGSLLKAAGAEEQAADVLAVGAKLAANDTSSGLLSKFEKSMADSNQ